MPKQIDDKLLKFQSYFQQALAAYDEKAMYKQRQEQYDGTKEIGAGMKKATTVYNITQELIESQIDSSIPTPKVTPKNPTPKTLQNAQNIQSMLMGVIDNLPFENINDEDERIVKINGGSSYLVEWDNSVRTHDTVGDVSVRLTNTKQLIPQENVTELRYMDRFFITFDDTKERIRTRYGKEVEEEGIDPQVSDKFSTTSSDLVTQVICYYMNPKGGLGCFSWAGNTILISDDNYEARKDKVCAVCGLTKPHGENQCICGSKEWQKRDKDFEYLEEDIVRSDGTMIPAMSEARDEYGNMVMEDYEVPDIDPMTGMPMNDYMFDDALNVIGSQPRMATMQRPAMEQTKIPYYYPREYPVILRRNISKPSSFMGYSDCDIVRDFQLGINKHLTKLSKKGLKAGSYLTKPKTVKFEFSDDDVLPIEVESPSEIEMIKPINLNFDLSNDLALIDKYYLMAKSVLGITDSFQGKADNTAASGRAKEAQIAQAAGRQRSKRVMKNAAYADLYRMIFKFMLAYADEPRVYSSKDIEGSPMQATFDRYDFLEKDDYGNWYYDDQYAFSVDEASIDVNDKRFMLEDLRTDFNLGAYGNPTEPDTMIAYWTEKEKLGYPNAAANIKRWEKKAEKMALLAAQQAAMQQIPPDDGFGPIEGNGGNINV